MADAAPDMMIGNFRLLRPLGEGGMGVVYEAEHVAMGRRAAVKILRSELIKDEQAIRRFFNEARATNEVRHPGIVQIYDCGTRADGSPWLIMELLEGETLARRIARLRRLVPHDVIDLGAQAASVLEAAHGAGIIHRDLKPDNLFVVPDLESPTGERVKVLDFGIAKLSRSMPAGSMPTQTGTLMGTPLYMSPEQCRGTKQIDARSDIYSLGLILYQMAAGELPFVSEGIGELFDMQMNRPAPRLEQKNEGIGLPLAAAIHRALEKNPADRFQSMADLQQALLVAGDPANVGSQHTQESVKAAPRPYAAPRTMRLPTPGASTTLSASASVMETERLEPRRSSRMLPLVVIGAIVVGGGALALRSLTGTPAKMANDPSVPTVAEPKAGSPNGPPGSVEPPKTPPPATQVPTTPPPPPVAVEGAGSKSEVVPAAAAAVMLDIKTTPTEAQVLDLTDGQLVGVTPLHQELTRRGRELKLKIEKEGYLSRTVTIPPGGEFRVTIKLERPGAREPRVPAGNEHIIKL